MLAAEPGMIVETVDVSQEASVAIALATEPEVIVVEEGGAVDAAEIVRRSHASLVLDVDINTTSAFTLRRQSLSSRPDDFLATIREAIASASTTADPDRGMHPAGLTG